VDVWLSLLVALSDLIAGTSPRQSCRVSVPKYHLAQTNPHWHKWQVSIGDCGKTEWLRALTHRELFPSCDVPESNRLNRVACSLARFGTSISDGSHYHIDGMARRKRRYRNLAPPVVAEKFNIPISRLMRPWPPSSFTSSLLHPNRLHSHKSPIGRALQGDR
jgi:hypothetical protein